MTKEKLRQKAIECGEAYQNMCLSSLKCTCEYQNTNLHCEAVYGYEHGFADGVEEGKQLANVWIPVTERLPACEEAVLITVERRPVGGEPWRRVARAFHEDGNMNTEDSGYCWNESEGDWEYDEESGGYIIPEEWYEDTDYCEEFGFVDDVVIAWMPLPEPFKEGEKA